MSLPKDPPDRSAIRVLIVASAALEADLRDALATAPDVEVAGAAADGAEGLRLVADLEPDVALIELEAPGVDGIALTRRIAGRSAATHVIIVAAELRDDDVRRAMMAGAGDYFARPLAGDELVAAIRRLSRSSSVGRLLRVMEAADRRESSQQDPQTSLRARLRQRVLLDRTTGKIVDLLRIACEDAYNAENPVLSRGERERLIKMVLRDVLLEILTDL